MNSTGRNTDLRQRIACEAARILADGACQDVQAARRKAAKRLGCKNRRLLPDHGEIEQALREHQRLFQGKLQPLALKKLRRLAAEAMAAMACFNPRLVGPVLTGTAGPHSKVQLHLFADTPEQVILFLLEQRIPWQDDEKTLCFKNGEKGSYPVCRFRAGDAEVELTLFPPEGLRRSPLGPLGDQPLQRASLGQLQELMREG
ncbi:MAG TPA: hypothetical protein ENI99_00395 [Sedimenticola sp.]|nr:hypothetical protein [Sedimenticola sp.]